MSKKMLIIIIAVFFLMMGMMGGGFFIMWRQMSATVAQVQQGGGQSDQEAQEAEAKEQEATIGPLYKLDTMIVNLADHGGKRYLRVTMEMELKVAEQAEPSELIEEIDKRLPQLRDTILMSLPAKQ